MRSSRILPATVKYYNQKFNGSIPVDAGIDIYDPTLDGHKVLEKLNTPVKTCEFCSCTWTEHKWDRAPQPSVDDYEAAIVPA